MSDGRRTLRLSIPEILQEEDHRGSYRVDRVGRVPVTFSTPKYDLVIGTLVDISTTGARIFSSRDFEEGEFLPGDDMAVTIQLTDLIRINTKVKLRHVRAGPWAWSTAPSWMNICSIPSPAGCSRSGRRIWNASPGGAWRPRAPSGVAPPPASQPKGLVLVSGDAALEAALQDLLGGLQPLRRVPPTMSALKEAFNQRPALVLYHVPSLGLDERRRLKPMVEPLQGRVPFLLLGTAVEGGALLELGSELKAAVSIVFNPERGIFFQRLVQGVLRRIYEGGEVSHGACGDRSPLSSRVKARSIRRNPLESRLPEPPCLLPTNRPSPNPWPWSWGFRRDEWQVILRLLDGRLPTYPELGVFSAMWSEHCSYKSSRLHLKNLPTEGPGSSRGPAKTRALWISAMAGP